MNIYHLLNLTSVTAICAFLTLIIAQRHTPIKKNKDEKKNKNYRLILLIVGLIVMITSVTTGYLQSQSSEDSMKKNDTLQTSLNEVRRSQSEKAFVDSARYIQIDSLIKANNLKIVGLKLVPIKNAMESKAGRDNYNTTIKNASDFQIGPKN